MAAPRSLHGDDWLDCIQTDSSRWTLVSALSPVRLAAHSAPSSVVSAWTSASPGFGFLLGRCFAICYRHLCFLGPRSPIVLGRVITSHPRALDFTCHVGHSLSIFGHVFGATSAFPLSFRSAGMSTQPTSPNQALQRTRLRVTAPASAAAFPPTVQVPRRSGVSLSLWSLGVLAHRAFN